MKAFRNPAARALAYSQHRQQVVPDKRKEELDKPYRHPECDCCNDQLADINRRAHQVGEALLGTQQMIHNYLSDEEEDLEDDADFCSVLDTIAMQCGGCGLWSEPSEVDHDTDTCNECRPDAE